MLYGISYSGEGPVPCKSPVDVKNLTDNALTRPGIARLTGCV